MNSYLKPKYQVIHLLITVAVFGGLFLHQIISAQQPSSNILGKLKDDPGLPLIITTFPETPITITEALSREISGADFRTLTGFDANSDFTFSFPEVKILNTSGKVITGFGLVLQIKDPGRFYFVKPSQLNLEPNDNYTINPNKWVSTSKLSVRTAGEKIEKVKRTLDFDSSEMWIPGRISDASLFIVDVKFSDGTAWKVKGKS